MDAQTHWEKIYTEKAPDAVSWYRPHLETSLALIKQAAAELRTGLSPVLNCHNSRVPPSR
jgi:hypothetical protein